MLSIYNQQFIYNTYGHIIYIWASIREIVDLEVGQEVQEKIGKNKEIGKGIVIVIEIEIEIEIEKEIMIGIEKEALKIKEDILHQAVITAMMIE